MDPITATLAANAILALLQIWAQHSGKPAGWKPGVADWAELEAWASRTPEQIKHEARERLSQTEISRRIEGNAS